MTEQAFLNLRPQMLNEQCRDCFDLLSPYFPRIDPDFGFVAVNLQYGYKENGTGICNFNMLQDEALAVVDTLQEINCPCLFVAPVPVSGLFTEQYIGVGAGSEAHAYRVLQQLQAAFMQAGSYIKFPPYFSVHMAGAPAKPECRGQLKELLIQNLHSRKPASAASIAGASDTAVSALLSRFTLSR